MRKCAACQNPINRHSAWQFINCKEKLHGSESLNAEEKRIQARFARTPADGTPPMGLAEFIEQVVDGAAQERDKERWILNAYWAGVRSRRSGSGNESSSYYGENGVAYRRGWADEGLGVAGPIPEEFGGDRWRQSIRGC